MEIKEILEFLKVGINKLCISKPDFSISYNDVKILLDYITNLQQENQELNDSVVWWNNRFNAVQRDYERNKLTLEQLTGVDNA